MKIFFNICFSSFKVSGWSGRTGSFGPGQGGTQARLRTPPRHWTSRRRTGSRSILHAVWLQTRRFHHSHAPSFAASLLLGKRHPRHSGWYHFFFNGNLYDDNCYDSCIVRVNKTLYGIFWDGSFVDYLGRPCKYFRGD